MGKYGKVTTVQNLLKESLRSTAVARQPIISTEGGFIGVAAKQETSNQLWITTNDQQEFVCDNAMIIN